MIAVGVTTYNRAEIVTRAIASALAFVEPLRGPVILVDDASIDGTVAKIRAQFAQALASGRLVLICHSANRGVTAAKNTAFEQAAGIDWMLFLDSDDELIAESAAAVAQVLDTLRDAPIVFFRCIDENNKLVGRQFSRDQILSLARFTAHTSYGEALVAMQQKVCRRRFPSTATFAAMRASAAHGGSTNSAPLSFPPLLRAVMTGRGGTGFRGHLAYWRARRCWRGDISAIFQ